MAAVLKNENGFLRPFRTFLFQDNLLKGQCLKNEMYCLLFGAVSNSIDMTAADEMHLGDSSSKKTKSIHTFWNQILDLDNIP